VSDPTRETEFLEKAARVAEVTRKAVLANPGPTPIAMDLPANMGEQRTATCGCGSIYTQTMLTKWSPDRCRKCAGHAEDDVAQQTADARATFRAAMLEVPTIYRDANLANYRYHGSAADREKQGRVHQLALRYIAQWPMVPAVIVMRGGYGTGKGHMTYAIAKQLVNEHGAKVAIEVLPDIIRDLREAWNNRDGESEARRLARYRDYDLLVIDEVSKHAFYGDPVRHLYDLVAHREKWGRPTILTSNETPLALTELLGPALTSRAVGSSGLWEFGDADYRLFARKERDAA
jgi:DNA replication protein DnaC